MAVARLLFVIIVTLASVVISGIARPNDYTTDKDLFAFVSRPDLRPPKYEVDIRNASRIAPGYWFVAPYDDLRGRAVATTYVTGQIGPHIYDGSGDLVWSGANLFGNRPTFDFKTSSCNGSPCMTFILNRDHNRDDYPDGAGVILDNSFTIRDTLLQGTGNSIMNMHEFTISPSGTSTTITFRSRNVDVTSSYAPQDQQSVSGWVGDNGFRELDIVTGVPIFEWWPLDHIHPSESLVERPKMPGTRDYPWDFFHLNSVDKNGEGDYLISSRYLNAIYKISGIDGHIIWQLGGRRSTFTLRIGFKFSSQHDARFRSENTTHTVISFLNNAADSSIATSGVSSALTVLIDHEAKTAQLLDSLARPDHELTHLRGNVQHLEDGHKFVCWSENARISEFDRDGELLLDAHFVSHRFVTYRAYKFNFTGAPLEPPALVSHVYGTIPGNSATTALYISWNGATAVHTWRFYSIATGREPTLLGEVRKEGFETEFMVSGTVCSAYAEAIAVDGKTILGTSPIESSIFPLAWNTTSVCKAAKPPSKSDGRSVFSDFELSFLLHTVAIPLGACFAFVAILLFCLLAYKARSRLQSKHRPDIECKYAPLINPAADTSGQFKNFA